MEERRFGDEIIGEDPFRFTYKITTEASEKFDEFIFKTVQPFCEQATEMMISKNDLIEALTMWKKSKPKPLKLRKDGYYGCPNCLNLVGHDAYYCSMCGQAIIKEQHEE